MKLSKRYTSIISKYRDISYLERVPKYIMSYDLQSIGINIKPCYDSNVLRNIIKVIVERCYEDER